MQKIILKIEKEEFEWLDKDVECFILSSALPEKFIDEFHSKAQILDKIVLVEGDNAISVCKKLDLDGVIIDLTSVEKIKEEMDKTREDIGNKFLGVVTRTRRHEAMIVSENEPEFVIFKVWNDGIERLEELVDWYLEFFLLQLAIMPQDEEVDFSKMNADIVILDTKKYKILVDKK